MDALYSAIVSNLDRIIAIIATLAGAWATFCLRRARHRHAEHRDKSAMPNAPTRAHADQVIVAVRLRQD